ncbi:MAG: TlpA family protein disulfide reductase [Deltaproteobacteria bacterium]|nr:TlpA family protein disulfide reductase [Deltaproteobacteria bacterium]
MLLGIFLIWMSTFGPCSDETKELIGQKAPPLRGVLVTDGVSNSSEQWFELESLRGKTVVVDFWASWCPPCRASVPVLEAFARAHPEVQVLGVNVEGDRDPLFVAQAHRSLGATYPTIHDTNGQLLSAYRVRNLPTIFVIDPDGKVKDTHVGVVSRAWLEEKAGKK